MEFGLNACYYSRIFQNQHTFSTVLQSSILGAWDYWDIWLDIFHGIMMLMSSEPLEYSGFAWRRLWSSSWKYLCFVG